MTPNNAWRYCENLTPSSMVWATLADELKAALAVAGHPAGRA